MCNEIIEHIKAILEDTNFVSFLGYENIKLCDYENELVAFLDTKILSVSEEYVFSLNKAYTEKELKLTVTMFSRLENTASDFSINCENAFNSIISDEAFMPSSASLSEIKRNKLYNRYEKTLSISYNLLSVKEEL